MFFRFADAIFWLAVVSCAVAQLAILRSVIISPARAAGSATATTASRRAGEIAWAVLPGVGLAIVLVYTWRAMQ